MKRTILIPCSGFEESKDCEYLWDLLFIDPSEYSPREAAKVDEAMTYGLVYHAEHVVQEDTFLLVSDLGDPDSKFGMEFPNFVSLKLAAIAMAAAVDKLMEGENHVGMRRPHR